MNHDEYIRQIKKSYRYQNCLNSTERKRMLQDAEKKWQRKMKKKKEYDEELDY